MKKVLSLLTLVVPFLAFAQVTIPNPLPPVSYPVYPHIYNYGNRAEVQVWNQNAKAMWCNGMVDLHTQNHTDSQFFSEYVMPHFTLTRSLMLRYPNETIQYISHSIFCH